MSPDLQRLYEAYALTDATLGSVAPVLLVAVFGVFALVADLFERGSTRGPAEGESGLSLAAPYLSMVGVGLGLVAIVWQWMRLDTMAGAYFSGTIAIDGFGLFLSSMILIGTLITLLVTAGYSRRQDLDLAEYYHLIMMAAVGMMLMAQARNLVLVFAALELMSVSVYVLTGFKRRRVRAIEGALKYFVLGAFSTGFVVYGMALVYGGTGTLDLVALADAVHGGATGPLMIVGVMLVVIGFAFKVALVPFHMWSPDVYEAAPVPITGFMATGVKAAAFGAFVRFLVMAFGEFSTQWVPVLWILAVLTMFIGNVAAIRQDDIKRMLAYSSIAHAGYLTVAVVANSALGVAAFLYYMAAYTLMTLGAFAVVAVLGERGDENTSIREDYAGVGYRHPAVGAAMALFMFSLTGIPPSAGFFGKFSIFAAAVDAGYVGLALMMAVASVISAYYYLRVVVAMYMGGADRAVPAARIPALAVVALLVTTVGVLALGIGPGQWVELARASVDGLGAMASRP